MRRWLFWIGWIIEVVKFLMAVLIMTIFSIWMSGKFIVLFITYLGLWKIFCCYGADSWLTYDRLIIELISYSARKSELFLISLLAVEPFYLVFRKILIGSPGYVVEIYANNTEICYCQYIKENVRKWY